MTLWPSSSTNFSRTLPLTCRRQRLWKLQPHATRISRFWSRVGTPSLRPTPHTPTHCLGLRAGGYPSRLARTWVAHGAVERSVPAFPELPILGFGDLLEIPLTQRDPVGRPASNSPSAMGGHRNSQRASTLMSRTPWKGLPPPLAGPSARRMGTWVPPARLLPRCPRGSPPAAGPVSGRQAAAGGPEAGRQAPSDVWRRLPGPEAGLGQ